MDEFGMPKASGVVGLIEDLTKNDNSRVSFSGFQSIVDDLRAHPEDISIVITSVTTSLESQAKDWRKINKTLALSISLIKSGNIKIIEELRAKENLFKNLTEFFYIESQVDKGGVVRDKSRMIYHMLTNPEFVDYEREPRRSVQEKKSSWKETNYENNARKHENNPKIQENKSNWHKQIENHERPKPEAKKINIFEGVNVKNTSNPAVSSNLIESDLLGDISSQPPPQKKDNFADVVFHPQKGNDFKASPQPPPKNNEKFSDLLIEDSGPVTSQNLISSDLLFDAPITNEKPAEKIFEPKNEPKNVFNISGNGPSINMMKTAPSIYKPPAPQSSQSPPKPKDLESRLLGLEDLTSSLAEDKPKPPPPRSYY